jgi:hypothetical protein
MISPSEFHSDKGIVLHDVKPSSKRLGPAHRPAQRAAAAPSLPALPPN